MSPWLGTVLLLFGVLGLPPITETQRVQLETFRDDAHPDQPALYALLSHVAAWEPGVQAGARLPDWSVIRETPRAWRGEAVVLEGVYAGRQRRWPLTRRQAPWGDALTEWGVVVGDDPTAVRADPAAQLEDGSAWPVVVLFVDPDETLAPPTAGSGTPVRIVARYLGAWRDADEAGAAQRYPVFVARHAEVLTTSHPMGGGYMGPAIAGLLVVTVLAIFWRLRAAVVGRDLIAERRARRRGGRAGVFPEPQAPPQPEADELPGDPDAALRALGDRGD